MATIEIDVEATTAFVDALTERLEAEEFEALTTGRPGWERTAERGLGREWFCAMDGLEALLIRRTLASLDDDVSALWQLRLRKDIDRLRGRYPDLAAATDALMVVGGDQVV